jgi:hypothetical protein
MAVKKASKTKKAQMRKKAIRAKIRSTMKVVTTTSPDRVHVISHNKGWAVQREGAVRASKVFPKKDVAVSMAKSLAKKGAASDVVIHNKDGTIQKWDKE